MKYTYLYRVTEWDYSTSVPSVKGYYTFESPKLLNLDNYLLLAVFRDEDSAPLEKSERRKLQEEIFDKVIRELDFIYVDNSWEVRQHLVDNKEQILK